MIFKVVVKNLFSLQNLMKKLFETHYSLEKNCLQVPKMVTPPGQNNGPSLKLRKLVIWPSYDVITKK